ncbi:hypothetical protein [Nocardioides daphniae]|nr:hypothetical protein [Nocardioides daphniae]
MTNTAAPTKHNPIAWIKRLLSKRGTGGITVTAAARTTYAADLEREAHRTNSDSETLRTLGAPAAAIAIRSEASAVQRATRTARRAERRTHKAAKRRQRRADYEARVRQVLTRTRTRTRVKEAEIHDLRSAATGYLTAWLPAIGNYIVAVAMAANDPGFVYTTLRQVFDVPTSVGILDVTNPDVVVALAAALATTAVLLAAAHLVGKSLGTLLWSGPVLNKEHPEVARTWNDIRPARMVVKIVIGGAVLVWFIHFLHTIAAARFEQDTTAVFGSADEINSSVVWFITLLPVVVTAFEVIAASPSLAHARKSARWSFQMRIAEHRHIRRDQRLLKRERAAYRRALRDILKLTDILKDVGRRALAEIVDASLTTGRVDLTNFTKTLSGARGGVERDELSLDLSGTTTNPYLPGLPVVSNTVAHAINIFNDLGSVPDRAPLAADWRDLRKAPDAYQPYPLEETQAQQVSEHAAGSHQHATDFHRVTPAVENTAATTEPAA